MRDHIHRAEGYFLALQIPTFGEASQSVVHVGAEGQQRRARFAETHLGAKEAVDADAHEAEVNGMRLAVAEYKRALLVTHLFLWCGDGTKDIRRLAVNWDIGRHQIAARRIPHGVLAAKLEIQILQGVCPLAPTVTLGKSYCPKSRRCTTST